MRDLFLLIMLLFLKKSMLLKNLFMCIMIILLSRFTCFDLHNAILKTIFMSVLSSFYKTIVQAINLVLLILSTSIMLFFGMNFGLYFCSIIITKIFMHHQIMVTSETLSEKPEKFDCSNLRHWQNQMRLWLTNLNLISAIENDNPSSSRPTTRSTTESVPTPRTPQEIEYHCLHRILGAHHIDCMTFTTQLLVLNLFGIL